MPPTAPSGPPPPRRKRPDCPRALPFCNRRNKGYRCQSWCRRRRPAPKRGARTAGGRKKKLFHHAGSTAQIEVPRGGFVARSEPTFTSLRKQWVRASSPSRLVKKTVTSYRPKRARSPALTIFGAAVSPIPSVARAMTVIGPGWPRTPARRAAGVRCRPAAASVRRSCGRSADVPAPRSRSAPRARPYGRRGRHRPSRGRNRR